MDVEGATQAFRARRDASRWTAVVGRGLLFVSGALAGLGGLALAILAGAVLMAIAGLLGWVYWGWRMHRIDDPWAYDPELDGPVAAALEGRAFPPPPPATAASRRSVAAGLLFAVACAAAAAWSLQGWSTFDAMSWGASDPAVAPLMLTLAWGAATLALAAGAVGGLVYAVGRVR